MINDQKLNISLEYIRQIWLIPGLATCPILHYLNCNIEGGYTHQIKKKIKNLDKNLGLTKGIFIKVWYYNKIVAMGVAQEIIAL